MTWMGPTYAMWSDTVDEMNDVIALANQKNQSLEQWKAYAKKLETSLLDIAEKHKKTREAYVTHASAAVGQASLKDAALKELERLDPSNKLLDPDYRLALYNKERDAAAKNLQKK